MEKATTRIIRTSEWKSPHTSKPKQEFSLYGKVLKVLEHSRSILVEKGGSKTTFWLSVYGDITKVEVGRSYRFIVVIASYLSKAHQIYTTHLAMVDAILVHESEEKDLLPIGFDTPVIPVNIIHSHKTEIPGLYIIEAIRMKDGEEMESYYLRYWSKERLHPELGTAMLKFTVKKYENMIDHKGVSQTMLETRTFINSDGEEVTVETPKYQLGLTVLEIIR